MSFVETKSEVLYEDGSLRDAVIGDTTRESYEDLLSFINEDGLTAEILIDGEASDIEKALSEFDRGDERLIPIIRFSIGKVCMACHFFTEEEIEIDFMPNEVKSEYDWQKVISFFERLSKYLNKDIGIFPENMHETCLYQIKAQQ